MAVAAATLTSINGAAAAAMVAVDGLDFDADGDATFACTYVGCSKRGVAGNVSLFIGHNARASNRMECNETGKCVRFFIVEATARGSGYL